MCVGVCVRACAHHVCACVHHVCASVYIDSANSACVTGNSPAPTPGQSPLVPPVAVAKEKKQADTAEHYILMTGPRYGTQRTALFCNQIFWQ